MALPLVGREQELEEVVSAFDALSARPQAVVVEGEAGIGKTALWREALRLAEQRSFRVLSCAASELEL
jgi:predicted ATPase